MPGHYPDKPPTASDGEAFAELCVWLMQKFLGETIHVYADKRSQFDIGESAEGVEFKELKRSHDRLHIEIAERVSVAAAWVRSGIMRPDNTTRYMCGNSEDVFLFRKADLVAWRTANQPRLVRYGKDANTGKYRLGDADDESLQATIASFVLPKEDARRLCLYRFRSYYGQWEVAEKNAELPEEPEPEPQVAPDPPQAPRCHCGEWAWWGAAGEKRCHAHRAEIGFDYEGKWRNE